MIAHRQSGELAKCQHQHAHNDNANMRMVSRYNVYHVHHLFIEDFHS